MNKNNFLYQYIDLSEFHREKDSNYNATVGRNGYEGEGPNFLDYARGYLIAADFLLEEIINSIDGKPNSSKDLLFYRDSLVYPLISNYRHGIELALKHFVYNFEQLGNKPDHSIGKLLEKFMNNEKISALPIPDRDEKLIKIEKAANTMHLFDRKGLVSRYPIKINKKEGKEEVTIKDYEHINYLRIRECCYNINDIFIEFSREIWGEWLL